MQRMLLPLLAAALVVPAAVSASDYQISTTRRKEDAKMAQGTGHQTTKASESFLYEVVVANKRFQAGVPLKAHWVILVEREELGAKQGSDKLDWATGTAEIAAIPAHGKGTFKTDAVTLRDQSLTGGWIYEGGGKIRAKDSFAGVWIKLFDGDKQVGEYVNPSAVASRHKWEKVSQPRSGKAVK